MKKKYILCFLFSINLSIFASQPKKLVALVWFQKTEKFSKTTAIFPGEPQRVLREDTSISPATISAHVRTQSNNKKIFETEIKITAAMRQEFMALKQSAEKHAQPDSTDTQFKFYDDNSFDLD